jgi:glycosyltransferase involved in cell wall biosynthesis
MNTNSLISIVVAAYNEAENVATLRKQVRKCLEAEKAPVEIVFVDDGSTDDSIVRVLELRRQDPLVRLIRLSRNFGNQSAFLAGIQAARGAAVITMDCDLQHPPSLLPRMLAAWRNGSQVVQMVRRQDKGASFFHRASSRLFHWMLGALTDITLPLGAGDFRLLDRKAADLMVQFAVSRPFYRGIPHWLGLPLTMMEYDSDIRNAGRPRLGWLKRIELSLDAITALSVRPLRLAFFLGICAIVICLAYALVTVIAYMMGHSVPGYPTLILAIVFLGAVQLVSIGILGEYLGRVHEQSRGLPPFVVLDNWEDQQKELDPDASEAGGRPQPIIPGSTGRSEKTGPG